VLSLQGVSFQYAGARRESLYGVDLELRDGTVTGLVGPAEAGKTTLCLVAGGLAPRSVRGRLTGAVGVDLVSIASWPMERVVGQVVVGLQDPAAQLTGIGATVFEEVAFGPANLGLARPEVVARTWRALEQVGADGLAERDPARLSGGQQQLVVLAGLLAMRARHLILDEPLAHLDAAAAGLVLRGVRAAADAGAAVLVAEQRIDELVPSCDQLAVMAAGNIVAAGQPDTVLADPAVAALGVETAHGRLTRRLTACGLDPTIVEGALAAPTSRPRDAGASA
jgi:energy-coupling factor transporter ATP-binding protein EcfA2